MKLISSPDNSLFRELKNALEPKGIHKYGRFLVSGKKVVDEMLKRKDLEIDFVMNEEGKEFPDLPPETKTLIFTRALFKELDSFGTNSTLLAIKVPMLDAWEQKAPPVGLEILCALSEPSNVGALLRSAAAFGASRVVLLKESATPFHPKSVRAASGQLMRIPLSKGPSIKDLKGEGLLALDMDGEVLTKFKWPKNARLLIGQEGPGVPELANLKRLKIPMEKEVESLNAMVAASIALYSYKASHG